MELPAWFWQRRPSAYLLALSGGRDSVALLHLLHHAPLQAPLKAIYVDHGWSPAAQDWGQWCQKLCATWGVPFEIIGLSLPEIPRQSREQQARQARYTALAAKLPPGGVLLTAHHQNDQVETLLLQLLRGAGVAGLASMPTRRPLGTGELWRPLRDIPRKTIDDYLRTHHLSYLDDPSNAELRYARNRLRQQVLPALTAAFPDALRLIARAADHQAEALHILDETADALLPAHTRLPVEVLTAQNPTWQRLLVRRWLVRQGALPPPESQLSELLRQIASAPKAELQYGQWVVVFYRRSLQLFRKTTPSAPPLFAPQVFWSGVGELRTQGAPSGASWRLFPPGGAFCPRGEHQRRPLKELFAARNLPPYVRRRTPILCCGTQLLWVGGIGYAAEISGLEVAWSQCAFAL